MTPLTRAPSDYIVAERSFAPSATRPMPDWQGTRDDYTLDQARADYDAGRVEIATGRTTEGGLVTEHIYAIPRRVKAPWRRWFGHRREAA